MLDKKTKDLLPAIIRDTMAAITEMSGAPDEMTLPVTLAVANFATQGLTNVFPHCWDKNVPLSEYFVVLVPSGGMKTSIYDMLSVGIKKFEREQEPIAKSALVQYKIDLKKFNKEVDDAAKEPTLVLPKEPVKPKGARYKVEKATVNGLLNTLEAVPFAGLFSSDAGEFFSSHSFQDTNKAIEMISTLSKAWSGEDLERNTGINDNNLKLHDRRFNMLVMLQQELAGFLNNSQFKDQGFTNRMLITQCELFKKTKIEIGHLAKLKTQMKTLEPFNERVYDLLDKVNSAQEAARQTPLALPGQKASWQDIQLRQQRLDNTSPNELILPLIMFDLDEPGLEDFVTDYYNEFIERPFEAKYLEYSNFMNRAFEHFCRLAATIAAFTLEDKISLNTAKCAHGLTEYFIEQRINMTVDGALKSDDIVECAGKVYEWLMKQPDCEGTKQGVLQGVKQYFKMNTSQRALVIAELEARDKLEVVDVPTKFKPKAILRGLAVKS